ncbi:uncharacterized protein K444DRAFT_515846 [Hyaloscypha bicolor E]|uniref:HNH domain-containing protein n=1 Tax=Hyaloscypha bicolor E TaxID=1095630 RepID=A0A2J6TWA6_9HELO|nr:uncharacterized protein K444DRAFT_515846 [Hyaloscypha bicolor E]PMD67271.1 hypothetical protein K444DRAFT_515846 [Hyaloscypha bicolor E]
MEASEESNFQIFRDCLSTPLIEKSAEQPVKSARKARGRKTAIKPIKHEIEEPNDTEELAEFIDYLAHEIFTNLPTSLCTLSYSTWLNTHSLQSLYSETLPPARMASILDPLPPTITDSLLTYSFLAPHQTTNEFLTPILTTYLSTVLTPPPPPSQQRPFVTECEICQRSWIPLTFHHLIPKGVHEKALKRGWHTEDQLNNVAWLCRACHSFVHRVTSLEDLAKQWYTVERLMEREDVRRFGEWVGRVRWKAT